MANETDKLNVDEPGISVDEKNRRIAHNADIDKQLEEQKKKSEKTPWGMIVGGVAGALIGFLTLGPIGLLIGLIGLLLGAGYDSGAFGNVLGGLFGGPSTNTGGGPGGTEPGKGTDTPGKDNGIGTALVDESERKRKELAAGDDQGQDPNVKNPNQLGNDLLQLGSTVLGGFGVLRGGLGALNLVGRGVTQPLGWMAEKLGGPARESTTMFRKAPVSWTLNQISYGINTGLNKIGLPNLLPSTERTFFGIRWGRDNSYGRDGNLARMTPAEKIAKAKQVIHNNIGKSNPYTPEDIALFRNIQSDKAALALVNDASMMKEINSVVEAADNAAKAAQNAAIDEVAKLEGKGLRVTQPAEGRFALTHASGKPLFHSGADGKFTLASGVDVKALPDLLTYEGALTDHILKEPGKFAPEAVNAAHEAQARLDKLITDKVNAAVTETDPVKNASKKAFATRTLKWALGVPVETPAGVDPARPPQPAERALALEVLNNDPARLQAALDAFTPEAKTPADAFWEQVKNTPETKPAAPAPKPVAPLAAAETSPAPRPAETPAAPATEPASVSHEPARVVTTGTMGGRGAAPAPAGDVAALRPGPASATPSSTSDVILKEPQRGGPGGSVVVSSLAALLGWKAFQESPDTKGKAVAGTIGTAGTISAAKEAPLLARVSKLRGTGTFVDKFLLGPVGVLFGGKEVVEGVNELHGGKVIHGSALATATSPLAVQGGKAAISPLLGREAAKAAAAEAAAAGAAKKGVSALTRVATPVGIALLSYEGWDTWKHHISDKIVGRITPEVEAEFWKSSTVLGFISNAKAIGEHNLSRIQWGYTRELTALDEVVRANVTDYKQLSELKDLFVTNPDAVKQGTAPVYERDTAKIHDILVKEMKAIREKIGTVREDVKKEFGADDSIFTPEGQASYLSSDWKDITQRRRLPIPLINEVEKEKTPQQFSSHFMGRVEEVNRLELRLARMEVAFHYELGVGSDKLINDPAQRRLTMVARDHRYLKLTQSDPELKTLLEDLSIAHAKDGDTEKVLDAIGEKLVTRQNRQITDLAERQKKTPGGALQAMEETRKAIEPFNLSPETAALLFVTPDTLEGRVRALAYAGKEVPDVRKEWGITLPGVVALKDSISVNATEIRVKPDYSLEIMLLPSLAPKKLQDDIAFLRTQGIDVREEEGKLVIPYSQVKDVINVKVKERAEAELEARVRTLVVAGKVVPNIQKELGITLPSVAALQDSISDNGAYTWVRLQRDAKGNDVAELVIHPSLSTKKLQEDISFLRTQGINVREEEGKLVVAYDQVKEVVNAKVRERAETALQKVHNAGAQKDFIAYDAAQKQYAFNPEYLNRDIKVGEKVLKVTESGRLEDGRNYLIVSGPEGKAHRLVYSAPKEHYLDIQEVYSYNTLTRQPGPAYQFHKKTHFTSDTLGNLLADTLDRTHSGPEWALPQQDKTVPIALTGYEQLEDKRKRWCVNGLHNGVPSSIKGLSPSWQSSWALDPNVREDKSLYKMADYLMQDRIKILDAGNCAHAGKDDCRFIDVAITYGNSETTRRMIYKRPENSASYKNLEILSYYDPTQYKAGEAPAELPSFLKDREIKVNSQSTMIDYLLPALAVDASIERRPSQPQQQPAPSLPREDALKLVAQSVSMVLPQTAAGMALGGLTSPFTPPVSADAKTQDSQKHP